MTTFAALVLAVAAVNLALMAILCLGAMLPPKVVSDQMATQLFTICILSGCAAMVVAYCAGQLWRM